MDVTERTAEADIPLLSISEALAASKVDAGTGLTAAEVRRRTVEVGFGYAMAVCLVINDALKVALIQHIVPKAGT